MLNRSKRLRTTIPVVNLSTIDIRISGIFREWRGRGCGRSQFCDSVLDLIITLYISFANSPVCSSFRIRIAC